MKQYIFIILSIFLIGSCKVQNQQINKISEDEKVIILHTNDIHGNIDNFPRIAIVVDSIKKIHKNVFLLNAGDGFTGNPYVDMYKEKGFPVIDLMNDLKYDLSAIGNHEFDYGQEVLSSRFKQANFPYICANIDNIGGVLQKPKETYQFKTQNGLTLNIFSLIENSSNGLPESHPAKLKGLKFENGLVVAKNYKYLAKDANVFIALTHLGVEADEELAGIMPELDLIIGGHSHTVIDSTKIVNGVLIAQAGARLKYLGEVTLNLKNGKIIEKHSKLIPIRKNQEVDAKIQAKVNSYNKNPYFDEVLGNAKENISGTEELGCFITDAYRAYGNFDIAFQNSGGIRISEIEKGDITRGLIFKLDPFGNDLIKINMTLKEIKSLILNSTRKGEIDLRVSGIRYNVVTRNDLSTDVEITDYQGNALVDEKIYTVAMNDYILNTYNFDHAETGESLGITTPQILMDFLKDNPLNYAGVRRTSVDSR